MKVMEFFHYLIMIIIGSVFHLLFGYSMFDIFFKFPLNYGMTPHSSNLTENEIPSNRIVIIALDGTRSDIFFETIAQGKSPFLKEIVENRGVYGISHTKVPTETKPDFIAMFSGHFSDASLALKDLYSKKVLSDSIFNESNHAWGIGLDACLFAKVAKNMECINLGEQDFGDDSAEKKNYKALDTMIDILNKTKNDTNGAQYKSLIKSKISFLYHLIETDTIGHKDGPKSERLVKHLSKLDSYYQKLEKAFNDFYEDNKTTFIVTSDHGMDDRKAHGDGSPDNTRTPFVIWGAGIRNAIHRDKKPIDEDTPKNWNLDKIVRRDISQIDICPLSAALIGINFPMNSLGIIPLDILNVSNKVKSKMILGNFLELFEIYNIKKDIQSKSIIFKPYQPLIDSEQKINNILNEIKNQNYIEAINKTEFLINITLEGMNYILHYDRIYLKTIVIIGYILWTLYLFIFIEMKNSNCLNKFFFWNSKDNICITIISLLITLILIAYVYIRLGPFTYYLYTIFPCYFFWRILSNINYLKLFVVKENNIYLTIKNISYYIIGFLSFLSLVSINY